MVCFAQNNSPFYLRVIVHGDSLEDINSGVMWHPGSSRAPSVHVAPVLYSSTLWAVLKPILIFFRHVRGYCMCGDSLWNPRRVTWNRKPGISTHKAASIKWVQHQFQVNSSSSHAHLCNQALMIYACCRHTVCLGRLIKVSAEPLSLAASQVVEWYVQISLEFSCRAAVIFQVFFSSAPLSCQSPTSIKHGNQPLQGGALPQTHTQTLERPLLVKCRCFHHQVTLKRIFCFNTHSVLPNAGVFLSSVVHFVAHSFASQGSFIVTLSVSLVPSLRLFWHITDSWEPFQWKTFVNK